MMNDTRYKLSQYNIIFERNCESYIWNTFSGALIKLEMSAKQYIDTFPEMGMQSPYFDILKKNGCIVDASFNELGQILSDEKVAMMEQHPVGMHFTIAPGLGCNYDCIYCFEREKKSCNVMNQQTQEDVCLYIGNELLKNQRLQKLGITWFGGEPLLYINAIRYISDRLTELCTSRKVEYSAGIVTNGRLLTPEYAKILASCHVKYAQIAVDGTENYYAEQKGASIDDFAQTIDNIISTCEIIPITVRINLSNRFDEALALTEYLLNERKLDGKIKVYIAHIRDYTGSPVPKLEQQSHRQFLEYEKQYRALFGHSGKYQAKSYAHLRPKRRRTVCLSICENNFCIGPDGELYRCEHYFGDENSIVGSVTKGRLYPQHELTRFQFTHLAKCMICPLFPVCLGGCQNDAQSGDVFLSCEQWINKLIDDLMFELEHS